jgi:peptidoglycan DL-endopeptidase CwlO
MSVVDDVQTRIAAINQAFPMLAASSVSSSPSLTSSTQTYSSEFASALASASTNDIASGVDPNAVTSNASGDATAGGVTGAAVVNDAEQYLGVPYVYGGTDPSTGLDCSALVQRTYSDLGISLPRTSQEQATMGTAVASLAQAQPGDLVCFGSPATHIGIYLGNNEMIDAPHTGTNVQIQQITSTPSTIRRIVSGPVTSGSSTLTSGVGALGDRPAALSSGSVSDWPAGAAAYSTAFAAAERKYDLPSGLLSAVAHAESDYNPAAVSSAGAIGLMQLMPATAQAYGVDPTNPSQAIDAAAQLLKGELAKYGSIPLALAAYNAGGPAVDSYGGIPPYPQTEQYVQQVMNYMSEDA